LGHSGLGDGGASLCQQEMDEPNLETDSCAFGRTSLCVIVDLRFGFVAFTKPDFYLFSILRRLKTCLY
jgi:hypothetical protein